VTPVPALGKLRFATMRSTLGLTLSLAVLASACTGGTETGNPPFSGALSYRGFSSEPDRIGVRSAGSELSVRQAWLDLDSVSFSARGDCELAEEDAALTLPGLGVGDHAAGVHVVTHFEAPPASFCRIQLPFVRADAPGSGPNEVAGNSVLLLGELADGTALSIASQRAPVVELQAVAGGFRLDAEQAELLFAFDFAAWLKGVDLAGAERTAGAISIDGEHNAALLEAFERNLSLGVSLHRDRDGDGQLDVDSQPIAEPR
jgi:hypothetical protein